MENQLTAASIHRNDNNLHKIKARCEYGLSVTISKDNFSTVLARFGIQLLCNGMVR